MKRELEINKDMQELRDRIQYNNEEIEEEVVPGAYTYDIGRVESLKKEIQQMEDKYNELEAYPTKEKVENQKEMLSEELQEVDEELREYSQGGIYQKTLEMVELEEERSNLLMKIKEQEKILSMINDIEKLENDIDTLEEEKKEYVGAYFIPQSLEQDIEEKEEKLEELYKELENFAREKNKNTNVEQNKPEQNKPEQNKPEQNKPEQNKPEQNKPEQNKPEQNKPEQNKPEQNKPEQNKPEQNKPEQNKPEQNKPEQNKPEQNKPEQNRKEPQKKEQFDFNIIIGRTGKIKIGDWEAKIPKEDIKEGVSLNVQDITDILKQTKVMDIESERIQELLDKKLMDPVVINAIRRSGLEDSKKQDAIKKYCQTCIQPTKPKMQVMYDQKDLSKMSIFNRLFIHTELDSEEKYELLNRARMAERHGICKMKGEYRPGMRASIVASLTGEKIKLLPDMEDLQKVASTYNELRNAGEAEIARSGKIAREKFALNLRQSTELKSLYESQIQQDIDKVQEVANVYNELRNKGETSRIIVKEEREKIQKEKGLTDMQMKELRTLDIKQDKQEERKKGSEIGD